MKRWRIAGINFDHFHMGDLLRQTSEHPNAEIVGISDEKPALRLASRDSRWWAGHADASNYGNDS